MFQITMILLKLTYVFLVAGMAASYPTEKKVVESEKSTKQEKIVEFGVDGKRNEKVLQSSESIHYPVMSPVFFGYHPFPYIANYAPHYYPHTHAGFGGKQNGATSNYGGGYGNFGTSYGGSGFGYSSHTHGHGGGGGYGGAGQGYGGGGGYGGANQGYGGHGYGHGHEHGNWF